jgi:hypothetical protein
LLQSTQRQGKNGVEASMEEGRNSSGGHGDDGGQFAVV